MEISSAINIISKETRRLMKRLKGDINQSIIFFPLLYRDLFQSLTKPPTIILDSSVVTTPSNLVTSTFRDIELSEFNHIGFSIKKPASSWINLLLSISS